MPSTTDSTSPSAPNETHLITYNSSICQPFSSRINGERPKINYAWDGLLPQGGLGLFAGLPKMGKTSAALLLIVKTTKGQPFLGRDTKRGHVLFVSLENPEEFVDDSLEVLKWNPSTDERLDLMFRLPYTTLEENLSHLEKGLIENPKLSLVVIDTLPKFLLVDDLNDYSEVLTAIQALRNLAVKYKVSIVVTAHCKKVNTSSPFERILGSTAIRSEPDCNVVFYDCGGTQRVIVAEMRRGRKIDPTILKSTLTESPCDGALIVSDLSLDVSFDEWKQSVAAKTGRKAQDYGSHIVSYLKGCEGHAALHKDILANVRGRTERVNGAVKELQLKGVLVAEGVAHSKTEPLSLSINPDALDMYEFESQFGGTLNDRN